MKIVLKWLGRILLLLLMGGAALVLFGPHEEVDFTVPFAPEQLGDDVSAYFAAQESAFSDIVQGTEKRVLWAGEQGAKTAVSLVYIHGFSATSQEIRPVPDKVATALGANLVFTRLAGHGRSGDAMAEPSATDWMRDTAEALAVGRAVGEKVIVLSTSTGGTLAAAAALREDLVEDVAGMIFVSPNFALNSGAAKILTWPGVRWWGPLVAGKQRAFDAMNEDHAQYWTNSYPTVALLPMAALVKAVDRLDLARAGVPALFVISDADKVVRAAKTREIAGEWGGASEVLAVDMGEGDDPNAHVIAGDILSPGQTERVSGAMVEWVQSVIKRE